MRTSIVRIGNSRGIRIPKILMEQARIDVEVELEAGDGCIVIRNATRPRAGWEAKFKEMAEKEHDRMVWADESAQSRWDDSDWEW